MYIFIPFCILTEYVFNLDGFFLLLLKVMKRIRIKNLRRRINYDVCFLPVLEICIYFIFIH